MSMVVSLATRARPQQLIETVVRSLPNFSLPDTQVIIQVDRDDDQTIWALTNQDFGPRVSVNVQSREDTVAEKWNRALSASADLYLIAADDSPFLSPHTDVQMLNAVRRFPDNIGVVYTQLINASFPGAMAITKGLADRLGHLFPEHFPYWFVDHWIDDIARMIGRVGYVDLMTDQSRPGKTMEMREPGWWATWFDAAYLMRRKIAHAIIDDTAFLSPQWQKDTLKDACPLVEYRSRFVNSIVRQQSPHLEGHSGLTLQEPRYQRVKQRAIDMLPHLLNDYGMAPAEADMFRRALLGQQERAA